MIEITYWKTNWREDEKQQAYFTDIARANEWLRRNGDKFETKINHNAKVLVCAYKREIICFFDGYCGSYYPIDRATYYNCKLYYLMESNQYGDEVPSLVVDSYMNVICETYDDLYTTLEEVI